MTYYLVKLIISAGIIVAVSEIAKRSSLLSGLLASLPVVSVLAILWLYWETKNVQKIAELSISIFWLVIPSLAFFVALPVLLKNRVSFYPSLAIATALTFVCYSIMVMALKGLGVKL